MRKIVLSCAVLGAAVTGGCANTDYPVQRIETPANVTHEIAQGDYRRVFNTAYHIVNRYGVVQTSSYRYGEITALISEDNSLFDKTRRTIQARIFDAGDFYEVECRVLIAVEDSEVASFPDQFQPRYSWKTIASDQFLETRLNNEIRGALSGGAWEAKAPLTPEPTAPPPAPAAPQQRVPADDDTGEVRLLPSQQVDDTARAQPAMFERLGVFAMGEGDYDRAAAAFRASIDAEPNAPFGYFLLAQARFSQGDFVEAAALVQDGLRVNPDFVGADLDLRELYAPGDATFAEQLAQLERDAADDDLQFLVGYLRHFSGDARGATEAFSELPGHALARTFLARSEASLSPAGGLESF